MEGTGCTEQVSPETETTVLMKLRTKLPNNSEIANDTQFIRTPYI